MILEAVLAAEKGGQPVNIEQLLDRLGNLDEATRGLCMDWLSALVGHFQLILAAEGKTYPELIQSSYRYKEDYLSFCRKIRTVEFAVNKELLSAIDANSSDLLQVTKMIDGGIHNLRAEEAERIFS